MKKRFIFFIVLILLLSLAVGCPDKSTNPKAGDEKGEVGEYSLQNEEESDKESKKNQENILKDKEGREGEYSLQADKNMNNKEGVASMEKGEIISQDKNYKINRGQSANFKFDDEIAVKYAVIALEEFDQVSNSDRMENFDLTRPTVHSVLANNKDDQNRKVVLVVFPHKTKNNHLAMVYLLLDQDGYFKLKERGYTTAKSEELIKRVDQEDFWVSDI
ncbi:hypothetical protein [Orenia marismortui]|uniref:hypothetical protein n=1 Tax=Orenia marismortui TaxID=46469 RepID=UPI00037798A4|nr:hypothetical protein [Orenia marismortui]